MDKLVGSKPIPLAMKHAQDKKERDQRKKQKRKEWIRKLLRPWERT